jgi:phosphatidylethanolamine-binding protein (PEBP) family uncharacterized protein
MIKSVKLYFMLSLTLMSPVWADSFMVNSTDMTEGEFMSKAQEFGGFGCSGEDLSPHLKWSNPPMTLMRLRAVVGGIGK